ncbi:cysteinyl-tRNA synthetase [Desulfobotulus alkaliphilus]|uniref:Cysteine--tRNA ligase n=1 Tax=Desulfobotulus alkaliphilus TaxID=622671 RepID=A0A562RV89_9BACT|nr:cysteine--tRNA ligase [Desulfobotulus alkaliphilus]TWI72296.1 cysteinyl-tRNA synthetase [Desulfobotulus alkaliphilus]
MTLRIYNTLHREKETFTPMEAGKVRIYVCGPTVYDYSHIGHARSVIFFDVMVRYFRAMGYGVTYVRNFTDVDDKIIQKAIETDSDSAAVSETFIQAFHEDMDRLHVLRPDLEPRATAHIGDIIEVVERLIEKGHAYPVDGDVYFAVETFEGYGKLSGRKLEDMEAGSRIAVDERKKNPHDFALWKAAKPGEPAWESPWGPGRPGWHIECTAMSCVLLGATFDIHGGGKDLIFPHHENEIAQSEAATGQPFARYWVHNGFVNINHEKMSKSLGNFLRVRDVIRIWHPEAIRLFLLSSHYRSPIDFTDQYLDEAAQNLDKIYGLFQRVEEKGCTLPENRGSLWQGFCEAMDDDFNTAKAMGLVYDAIRSANRLLDEGSGSSVEEAGLLTADCRAVAAVLGIGNEEAQSYFAAKKEKGLSSTGLNAGEIDALVLARTEARKQKDFKKADEIRKQLSDMGVVLEDKAEGTLWRMA